MGKSKVEARDNNLNILGRWIRDVLMAAVFLTRLPIQLNEDSEKRQLADVAWAFPVVGIFVGGLAGLALLIGFQLGLHPLACGLFAVITQVFVTGALHEDGLADVADGFGGGYKVADKLRIMRDSHVGSYGVLALVFSVTLRAGLIAGMATPTMAVLALISAGAVSRSLVAGVMNQLEMARREGLATGAGKPTNEATLAALGLGAAAAFLLLGASGWIVLAVAFGAAVMTGLLAKRQIGGQTGDVLGTTQQVTEAAVLLSVVAVM